MLSWKLFIKNKQKWQKWNDNYARPVKFTVQSTATVRLNIKHLNCYGSTHTRTDVIAKVIISNSGTSAWISPLKTTCPNFWKKSLTSSVLKVIINSMLTLLCAWRIYTLVNWLSWFNCEATWADKPHLFIYGAFNSVHLSTQRYSRDLWYFGFSYVQLLLFPISSVIIFVLQMS